MLTGKALGKAAHKDWGPQGAPIFPCDKNKRPLTQHGFKDGSTSKKQVLQMFALAGDRAVLAGVVTGIQAGFFVLDLDMYKGPAAERFRKTLKRAGQLPKTLVHTTMSGGQHYFYRVPAGTEMPRNSVPHDNVEIRGEGGYVIAPPSTGYEVLKKNPIAVAPLALIKRLQNSDRAFKTQTVAQLEQQVLDGSNFHEALALIAAKKHGLGEDPVAVQNRLTELMRASVGAREDNKRHSRWASVMNGNELGRISSSACKKFNPKYKEENFKERGKQYAMHKGDASATGFFKKAKKTKKTKKSKKEKDKFPFKRAYSATRVEEQSNKKYLVYPLIMESDVLVLSAIPKAGKTLASMTICLHAAAGFPMDKNRLVPMNAQGEVAKVSVVYFALEGQGAIRKRVRAWLKFHSAHFGNATEDDLHIYIVEQSVNLADTISQQDTVDKLMEANEFFIEKGWGPIGMIVFDTLTKAMAGKDQNSVEDTSMVFATTDMLREVGVDAAIVFVHHNSKAGGGPRGSSNILAEPDTVLSVEKKSERMVDGQARSIVELKVSMARAIDDDQQYDFAMIPVELGVNTQGIMDTAPVLSLLQDRVALDTPKEAGMRGSMKNDKDDLFNAILEIVSVKDNVTVRALHRDIQTTASYGVRSYYASLGISGGVEDILAGWTKLLIEGEYPPSIAQGSFKIDNNGVVSLDMITALQAEG